ncbi:DUF7168 domain-containing protein [Insolitispirillum peregrinum]|uniref:Uncharacterized protein n=1 Tax=Insolitispirillum peregrinum TaxID=80876 RepID=A0A1N7MF59_9PROT|nr:DUF2786 domain-containing protein [Insolitispirillum peregrinum]SIS84682.1 Protein of unknown function [Insolitispirillum peregrinum]
MSDTDRMVAKIKKLLALAASPNEAEAAAALSKAKELMEKHSISDTAIRLADITEAKGKASVADRPNRWESDLVDLVARAFGCKTIFFSGGYEPRGYGYRRAKGEWHFIAASPIPDIASYAFQVLLRQLAAQRAAYVAALPKNLKRATKIRRGDLFAEAWVASASEKVMSFAGQDRQADITAWIKSRYPALGELALVTRTDTIRPDDHRALDAGYAAGANVRLDQAVAANTRPEMIGRFDA